jgi:hypothetical protein
MKKVAIILTGDPRHLDFCLRWWQNLVDNSTYDIQFFSSIWKTDNLHLPKFKETSVTEDEVLENEHLCSDELKEYLNNPYETHLKTTVRFDYYFGRLIMLNKILKLYKNTIQDADVILHARWDCAIRNTNFFQDFVTKAYETQSYVFTGVQPEKHGLLHTNDWLYAGPTSHFIKDYNSESLQKHIQLFDEYYKENEVKAKSYLIGHNFYGTFLQHSGAEIQHFGCDSTLVRDNNLGISANFDDTWAKLLEIYLESLKNRG